MHQQDCDSFGLILIGDEILFGQRQDSHLNHFRELLGARSKRLIRCWLLPDEASILTEHLCFSMMSGLPVFVCGGIGATPDDLTRQCAAKAANRSLTRHPQAATLIEEHFGEAAYPTRIRMADLPEGCGLIPNPHNQIPGFTIERHHFLPGFPEMAWPMAAWVLEQLYPPGNGPFLEKSLWVVETPESALVPLMECFADRFPGLKLYSLPRLGTKPSIELGLRGRGDIDRALDALALTLEEATIPYQRSEPD
jgi:molybdopterin-biosynthesis enzyme MoeA-like protein